jgi:hypothetical protein
MIEIILVWWPVVFLAFALYHAITTKQEMEQLFDTIPKLLIQVWIGLFCLLILQLLFIFSNRAYRIHIPYLPGPGSTLFFFLSIFLLVLIKRKVAEARM